MNKITISEERLNQLINEAINEAIEDEGLGRWLGNAYQWGKNKWNNFRNEFNAGRNMQRYKNRDFDPYHGIENADDMRNFDGRAYADYRYDLTARRNNAATQYPPSQYRRTETQPSSDATAPQSYPDSSAQAAPSSAPSAPTANVQPNNNRNRQGVVNKSQAMIKKYSNFLTQKGFKLVNGQWVYAQDGSNSPALQSQYPDIVNAAKNYNIALKGAKGLYEGINESIIKEAVKQALEKYINENKKAGK